MGSKVLLGHLHPTQSQWPCYAGDSMGLWIQHVVPPQALYERGYPAHLSAWVQTTGERQNTESREFSLLPRRPRPEAASRPTLP